MFPNLSNCSLHIHLLFSDSPGFQIIECAPLLEMGAAVSIAPLALGSRPRERNRKIVRGTQASATLAPKKKSIFPSMVFTPFFYSFHASRVFQAKKKPSDLKP